MSRSYTVSELIERVRQAAGMLGSDAPDDTQIILALSQEYTELYRLLVDSKKGFFMSTQTITTDGTSTRPLPTDYYQTIRIDWQQSATQPLVPLQEVVIQELHRFLPTGPYAEAWLARGPATTALYPTSEDAPGVIEFFPTPPANQTYIHRYVPAPRKLAGSPSPPAGYTFIVEGFAGWEDRLIQGTRKRLQGAEEADTTDARQNIGDLDKRIAREAMDRNASAAPLIADVEGYDFGPFGRFPWRRLPRP